MMVEHLQKILVKEGLERWAWPLAESAEPAIKIKTVFSDEKLIPIGVSKFGGTPHVPMDFEWPKAPTGEPLSFLAQIHLAEFVPFEWMGWKVPLPQEGLISIFRSMGDSGEVRVFFFRQPKELGRWDDPYAVDCPARRLDQRGADRPDAGAVRFPPRSLSFDQFLSLPEVCERARQMGQTEVEAEAFRQFATRHNSVGGRHQMLGFAAGLDARPPGETLLLQLDSDPLVEWKWPGRAHWALMIPTEDLAACCFDRVKMGTG
jgi:uncharacterized protein YwqG